MIRRLLESVVTVWALATFHDYLVSCCRYLTADRRGVVPNVAAILLAERPR